MSGSVVAIVLFAALLHASWNAIVKAGKDTFLTTVLVSASAALLSLATLPFIDGPGMASWPYLAASVVAQLVYYSLLAAAYRAGDMSHAYPLMRGSAPLLVALASWPLIGERLSLTQMAAIACICAGMIGLTFAARARHNTRRTTAFALLNACVIASYTLIDGIGVRLSGAPAAYTMWIFVLNGLGLFLWMLLRRPADLLAGAKAQWPGALFGGAGTLASYGLALWAMTQAPVAAIAALRETSILFAIAIAAIFLREKITLHRALAIAVIAAGAALMRAG
ncbi:MULTISPECIES: DMT family transporter [unclassified Janthinobacterium]|uniref:DMT family transporter n=1 Tax=unclassified Janthinobacterium TaxID=2610881 RepID=UPI00161F0E8C|nr:MULTISPECIES: DMT family transporter [unclassified Janthinobacterium]MBB5366574.1 drug/metabolite transporter (DMT)-like permease [Janthinobacterium sp. K2C7]MBB5380948.1 drug/metabolite transporter (DMT)-like permease [Janthinobacterium sp. K2Li3]MBB5384956.1 drug/metabolite transporter (DMT)-like permease [Janthinobacterium sp. K2E3]